MTELIFGVELPARRGDLPSPSWYGQEARHLENLGFESLMRGERWLTDTANVPDPMVMFGYLAAMTTRIRLLTGIVILPLHQPVHLAKTAASVDYFSGGRLILGVAPGGDFPKEFESCGIPIKERGGRTEEAITVMRRLWREAAVDFNGRFYHVREGSVVPKPVQKGGPPIWIGGRGPWAIGCAAATGDGWFPSYMPPKRYAESWRQIRDLADGAGRDPAGITPAVHLPFRIDRSFEAAWPAAANVLGRNYNRSYDADKVASFCALGSVEDFHQAIGRLSDAGVRHIVLSPLDEGGNWREQCERAAEALALPTSV